MLSASSVHRFSHPLAVLVGAALLPVGAPAAASDSPERGAYSIVDGVTADPAPDRAGAGRATVTGLDALGDGSPRVARTIGGIDFADEPAVLLDALSRLLGPELGRGDALAHRYPELRGRGARSAARLVFGSATGERLLYLLARHGYNGSHLAFPGAAPWLATELDVVIAALEDLPPSARPYDPGRARPLVIDASGYGLARFLGPDVAAAGEAILALSGPGAVGIRLSAYWQLSSDARKRAILVHELAHDLVRLKAGGRDWADAWSKATRRDRLATGRDAPGFVSTYAGTDWAEDLSESVVAYRYRPELLKRRAPHRYALLRRALFEGREYLEPDSDRRLAARTSASAGPPRRRA